MKLIVGLGNPGEKYAFNRHNIGFLALDEIATGYRFAPWKKRFQGITAEGQIGTVKCVLLKPATYMNESGRAVGEAARFFKIEVKDIIAIHDELDLTPGVVRVKTGGGNAGHNGLKSISAHLGNEYVRVRLGIGHPGDKALVSNYVLHDFSKADRDWLDPLISSIARGVMKLVEGSEAAFLSEAARGRSGSPRAASTHLNGVDASAIITSAAQTVSGVVKDAASTVVSTASDLIKDKVTLPQSAVPAANQAHSFKATPPQTTPFQPASPAPTSRQPTSLSAMPSQASPSETAPVWATPFPMDAEVRATVTSDVVKSVPVHAGGEGGGTVAPRAVIMTEAEVAATAKGPDRVVGSKAAPVAAKTDPAVVPPNAAEIVTALAARATPQPPVDAAKPKVEPVPVPSNPYASPPSKPIADRDDNRAGLRVNGSAAPVQETAKGFGSRLKSWLHTRLRGRRSEVSEL